MGGLTFRGALEKWVALGMLESNTEVRETLALLSDLVDLGAIGEDLAHQVINDLAQEQASAAIELMIPRVA